jgi:hypothetical protein
VRSARTELLVADISLAVALVSLGVATYELLRAPRAHTQR